LELHVAETIINMLGANDGATMVVVVIVMLSSSVVFIAALTKAGASVGVSVVVFDAINVLLGTAVVVVVIVVLVTSVPLLPRTSSMVKVSLETTIIVEDGMPVPVGGGKVVLVGGAAKPRVGANVVVVENMGVAAVGVVTDVVLLPVVLFDAGAVVPVATTSGAPVGAVAFMVVVVIVPLLTAAPVVVLLPPGALVGVRNEMGTMGMVGTGGCAWTTAWLLFDQHSEITTTTVVSGQLSRRC
jgi:hypothetical protein